MHLRSHKNSFTLIELITVIAIMTLIATLGIPVWNSINKGANMRIAINQMQSAAFLARQQAITYRQRVAFGIPYDVVITNNYVRSNMLYRSYVIFTMEGGGTARPSRILGKVQTLPKGVIFRDTAFLNWQQISFLEGTRHVFSVKYFRFAPIGNVFYEDMNRIRLMGSPYEYQFTLTDGFVDEDGNSTTNASARVETCGINSFTGRCSLK
jgi:Tfp pilus assembly protein PilE